MTEKAGSLPICSRTLHGRRMLTSSFHGSAVAVDVVLLGYLSVCEESGMRRQCGSTRLDAEDGTMDSRTDFVYDTSGLDALWQRPWTVAITLASP